MDRGLINTLFSILIVVIVVYLIVFFARGIF